MKRFLLCAFLLISFSYSLFPQSTITYWIDPLGNDGNNGTSAKTPLATINAALNKIPNPLTYSVYIYVKPGNYTQVVNIKKSGNAGHPIIISNVPDSEKPIFYGNSNSIFSTANAVFDWSSNCNYITIDGINIENATSAGKDNVGICGIWIRGDYNNIKNCEIKQIGRSGVLIQGNLNIIDKNYIHSIVGYNNTYAGNNIELTSYKPAGSSLWTCNNNTISNNILTDNYTHFGISIFPDPEYFPALPANELIMTGNKVLLNKISNTGGGIYTRYQKDMEIIGNVIANNLARALGGQGQGISFEYLKNDQSVDQVALPINQANIHIYNNTIANNMQFGIQNLTSNGFIIKNNIISNNGGFHIDFHNDSIVFVSSDSEINYNLYSGSSCHWKWNTYMGSFEDWQYANLTSPIFDINGLNTIDPLFTGQGNNPYSIQLHSPAKNNGAPLAEVTRDINGINRPYWNKGVDIGAYERDEAQFRIGITGVGSGTQITHTIQSVGAYWEKYENSWVISSAPDIAASTYQTTGNTNQDKETWGGFRLKWIRNSVSDPPFGHAFYKISNSINSGYFYIDYRDAITVYSPNIFIQYDGGNVTYKYFNGNTYQTILNGTILRIWEMNNNGVANTNGLAGFWDNALVCASNNNHPELIWGPYDNAGSNCQLYQYITAVNGWYALGSPTTAGFYTDYTQSFPIPGGLGFTHPIKYKVAVNDDTSNTITVLVDGAYLDKKEISNNNSKPTRYMLNQNYPNPFNPATTIKYSIKDAGFVKLQIYDIIGREIKTLVNEEKQAGGYEVKFNGSNLASGVYIYKLTAGTFTQVRKMQILK